MAQTAEQPVVVAHAVRGPHRDGPLLQGELGIADHQLGVDLVPGADPGALRAGAVGAVEREVAWLEVFEAEPALGAGQVLGEGERGTALDLDVGDPLGQGKRGLQGLGQALGHALLAHQSIDNHLDGVLVIAVEFDLLGELANLAVDSGPGKPLFGQVREQALVLPLAPPHDWRQHLEASALLQLEDPVNDLLRSLSGHRRPIVGAVGDPDPGEEKPEVIVDLGDRSHCGARIS